MAKVRRAAALLLAAACVLSLGACKKKEVNISASEVLDAVKAALGEGYACNSKMEDDGLSSYYGVDLSKAVSHAAEEMEISVFNDVAIVLRMKDAAAADEAEAAVKDGRERLLSFAKMYPFSLEKVENSKVYRSGNYVAFFVLGKSADGDASEADRAALAKAEQAKIDAVWKKIFG